MVLCYYMYRVTIEAGKPHPQSPTKNTAPLLSELYIQIPKPQPTKKLTHPWTEQTQQWDHRLPEVDSPSHKSTDSNCFIFSGTRTKNSSASLPFKTESEIISEWVRNLFQKRGLLGPVWQHKFVQKRKELVRSCFQSLREHEPKQQSAYLQTQSRYKPYIKKVNQLLLLGLDKLVETFPRLKRKQQQDAFSKILRYLAFQHMKNVSSNSFSRNHSNNTSLSNSIALSLKDSKNTLSPRVLPNIYAPSREQYELQHNNLNSRNQLRQVQSTKHIPIIIDNEYALTPFYQGNPKEEDKVLSPRQSRKGVKPQIGVNFKEPVYINEKIVQQSSQSYDNRYDINNRCELNPRAVGDMRQSQNRSNQNPPSPKHHQFMPVSTPHFIFTQPHLVHASNYNPPRTQPIRASAHLRPHTHNPFFNRSSPKEPSIHQNNQPQKLPGSRSRAISASPNIKISFLATSRPNQNPPEKGTIPNDYEGQQQLRDKNAHRLGTMENRQMRQSYQINSWDNQLVPQDFPRSPCSPFYSSPITPKVLYSAAQGVALSPTNHLTLHLNPSSPSSGKLSMGRPSPRIHKQSQYRGYQQQRQEANDYNFKRRQKITVTASARKRPH